MAQKRSRSNVIEVKVRNTSAQEKIRTLGNVFTIIGAGIVGLGSLLLMIALVPWDRIFPGGGTRVRSEEEEEQESATV